MNYIIFDLEWNQCGSESEILTEPVCLPGEIIEIGAVKLDDTFRKTDELRLLIRPQFYPKLHHRIVSLTGLRDKELAEKGLTFPQSNSQQGASRHHMIFRRIFLKIFQAMQSSFHFL